MLALLFALPLIAGCWTPDLAMLPEGQTPFAPEVDDAPTGWLVTGLDVGATCPDGADARVYVIHPDQATLDAQDVDINWPATVLFHSGSLDLRTAPIAGEPTLGPGLQDPTRLTLDWSVRQLFATLGMYPDLDPTERHTGALVAALVDAGQVVIMPTNCWGDLWHNRQGVTENNFSADLFFRNGRVIAEWAFQLAADEAFAEALSVTMPVPIDPTRISLAGLGEGGRAVGELLVLQGGADPLVPGVDVYAALLDSPVEDQRAYQVNPLLFSDTLAAQARIFPDGDVDAGTITSAVGVPPTGLIYSVNDTTLPQGANDRLLARLQARPSDWVLARTESRHVLSNGDPDLAALAAAFLATATPPADPAPPAPPEAP